MSLDEMCDGMLPDSVAALEEFLCQVYAPKNCNIRSIPKLRWELFRSKNLEGEKLPPTIATFYPHLLRCNFTSRRDKSYNTPHPSLPPLEHSGWQLQEDQYIPVRCLIGPAPKEVVELVKCGCTTNCEGRCSCVKNELNCTPLCKCYASGCGNFSSKNLPEGSAEVLHEDDEEEYFF